MDIERKLYEANQTIESLFATTPEEVEAEEARQAAEGPSERPESLRDARAVLDRIISKAEG